MLQEPKKSLFKDLKESVTTVTQQIMNTYKVVGVIKSNQMEMLTIWVTSLALPLKSSRVRAPSFSNGQQFQSEPFI
jgi:hypothetical protein